MGINGQKGLHSGAQIINKLREAEIHITRDTQMAESSWVKALFIEPGSPWENGYIEPWNCRLRDELLNREAFYTLIWAKVRVASK
jgi:hypothetical protein